MSADPTPRLAVACLVLALAALIPAASLSLREAPRLEIPPVSAPRRGARDMDEVLARRIEARAPRQPGAWPAWVMHRRPLEVPPGHPLAPR